MAPMTSAERQRKYREKLKLENPEKLELLKKENAARTKQNYKKITQLSETLKKEQRKKWRHQKQKMKEEPNIEQKDQKDKRQVRYLLAKENFKLRANIEQMTRMLRTQRKTIYRCKRKMQNLEQSLDTLKKKFEENQTVDKNTVIENKELTTPFSKTERFIQENVPYIPSPEKEKVKKAIFEGYVLKESLLTQYSKAESQTEKDVLKNLVNNDVVTKYKMKTKLGYSCLGLKGRLRAKQRTLEKIKINRMKEIQLFLERDDNSRKKRN
ncbi:unnamed protein product [Chilo suppressalis]|uniref:Uncharacterized protein n=1 Tax=Chilo suppressalis TaxID=168631 RepID=A0ABN8ARC5_CHISP|nr:unnamed protein product [Chilo suppressalis]